MPDYLFLFTNFVAIHRYVYLLAMNAQLLSAVWL